MKGTSTESSRWIIVSNRLPVSYDKKKETLKASSGGLVTAIRSIRSNAEKVWVGCAPDDVSPSKWKSLTKSNPSTKELEPIFFDPELYDQYYNGFCNDLLWPLLHYETERIQYKLEDWDAYVKMNREFAKKIIEVTNPSDVIWVHDFHLFLLPQFLREARKKQKIGFFLHIPFPSSEIFRQFPKRQEILQALLSADLVGFHDYSYLRHFRSSLWRILGREPRFLSIPSKSHTTQLGVFPVSIDTEKIAGLAQKEDVKKEAQKIGSQRFSFLGVDRLDYIKGIDLKLKAFRILLQRYPEVRGKVQLIQVAVPTRTGVPEYIELKNEISQLVGEINGDFGTTKWTPIRYIYNHLELKELLALYRSSNALLVTSKRDGMNLVILEYIASQSPSSPGVAMLSEFTGALSVLSHTETLNPWDTETTAQKMREVYDLSKAERQSRWQQMFQHLKNYTATHWAESFIRELTRQDTSNTHHAEEIRPTQAEIRKITKEVNSREGKKVLFLDYDGTLVPIVDNPEDAVLPAKTFQLIKSINRKGLEVVVVSGRPAKFLKEQFGETQLVLASEHGARAWDPQKKRWRRRINERRETWMPAAIRLMADYTKRVPDSFIEDKSYSVAWHYRKSPEDYARYQALKLQEELESLLANQAASILPGKKIIEVRSLGANKGAFASNYLDSKNDLVWALAIGDDRTDEDLFLAVKERGASFKVGEDATQADFFLRSQESVIQFLEKLNENL